MATTFEMLSHAIRLMQAGQFQNADDVLLQVLRSEPAQSDAWHLRGLALEQLGKKVEAEQHIRRAIELAPSSPVYFYNLGHFLRRAGRNAESVGCYERSVAIKGDWPESRCSLADVLRAVGRGGEAEAHYRAALSINPNLVEAHNNLGNTFRERGDFPAALECYQKALSLRPGSAEIIHNVAMAYFDLDRTNEAISPFEQSLQIDPSSVKAWINYGAALYRLSRLPEATAAYDRALQIAPAMPEAHWNRAVVLLHARRWKEGFAEYEWRLQCPGLTTQPESGILNPWAGQAVPGQSILVYSEQGVGDMIQFARFLPLVKARCARLVVLCQPTMVNLFKEMNCVDQVAGMDQPAPRTDFHVAVGSLCHLFEIDERSMSTGGAYLPEDPGKVTGWKQRLSGLNGLRVGLVWAGDPRHRHDRFRSIHPDKLLPLLQIPDVHFVSLQKETRRQSDQQLQAKLVNWTSELNDFSDTAALVANLDLIISVDTAVCHLAGAMGKPVWLLNAHVSDWRWMADREDSPWYPTMRIFRQKSLGEWDEVITRVAVALGEIATAKMR